MENERARDGSVVGDWLLIAGVVADFDPTLIINKNGLGRRDLTANEANCIVHVGSTLVGASDVGCMIGTENKREGQDHGGDGKDA